MPKFLVELHDGRKLQVEADQPPTEDEVMQHLGGQPRGQPSEGTSFEQPSVFNRFANKAWQGVNPQNMVTGIKGALEHPGDTLAGLGKGWIGLLHQAKADYQAGHYLEAAGHAGAAALPAVPAALALAGGAVPATVGGLALGAGGLALDTLGMMGTGIGAGHIGDKMNQGGDIAEGMGEAAGLAGSLYTPKLAMKGAGKVLGAAGNLGTNAAKRIIVSNIKPGVLAKQNPNTDFGGEVLNRNLAPNFKGAQQAETKIGGLSDELSQSVANAEQRNPQPVSIQPAIDNLNQLEYRSALHPTSQAGAEAAAKARNTLLANPEYGQDQYATVMRNHPTLVSPQGTPIQVPTQVVVGREPIAQALSVVDRMKKDLYAGLRGKYGPRGEPTPAVDADKAAARGFKDVLNTNVPPVPGFRGAQEINAEQANLIPVQNALEAMGRRNASKFPLGIMDMIGMLAAGGGSGAVAGGLPGGAIGAALALALKHPTTAFPIAKGINAAANTTNKVGRFAGSPLAGQAAVAGQQLENSKPRRPVSLNELADTFDPDILNK